MDSQILQLIISLPAALGFALWTNVRKGLLVPAMLGGLVGWGTFVIVSRFVEGPFVPCLVASAVSALYAELLAARLRVPSAIFFIVAVIPLIPGRLLFFTISSAVAGDWSSCGSYALETLFYAGGIAAGISAVWAVFEVIAEAYDRKLWKALSLSRLHHLDPRK